MKKVTDINSKTSKSRASDTTAKQWDNDLLDALEMKQVKAYYTVSGLSILLETFRCDNFLDLWDCTALSEDTKRETWNKTVDVLQYAVTTLAACADMLKA